MNILVISYYYYPCQTPRANRWTALCEFWASQGNNVQVICKLFPGMAKKAEVKGVNITRVGHCFFDHMRACLTSTPNSVSINKNNNNFLIQTIYKKIKKLVATISHNISAQVKTLAWPDKNCFWFFSARGKLKKVIHAQHYDVIITVSYPYVDHLLGYIAKRLQPDIFWLVDISDPFYFCCTSDESPKSNLHNYFSKHSELKLFHSCDAISVTNKNLFENYLNLFPFVSNKIFVAAPLFSLTQVTNERNYDFGVSGMNLVFMGTLYKRIRSPEYLLTLFASLIQKMNAPNIYLHFFGSMNGCEHLFNQYADLINKNIFIHGNIDRADAIKVMYSANVLVNIGVSTPVQLPSKLVEYISVGKPILNVATISNDSSEEFLNLYPSKLCLQQNSEELVLQVSKLANFISIQKSVDSELINSFLNQFKVETISEVYLSAINNKCHITNNEKSTSMHR